MKANVKIASKLLVAILVLSALVVSGQQSKTVLTNNDVIKMVKEGLPDNVIISTIEQFPANYDVSPDAIIQLKRLGASGSVLTAMQEAERVKSRKSTEAVASSEAKSTQKKISKVSSDFMFELNVCQSSGGDSVTCWLLITNKAQERSLSIEDDSYIIDRAGGQYSVADMWLGNRGKQVSLVGAYTNNTLIPEVPMAAILKFQNVRPSITSLSILRIACRMEGRNFNVDFQDVSITPKPQPTPTPTPKTRS